MKYFRLSGNFLNILKTSWNLVNKLLTNYKTMKMKELNCATSCCTNTSNSDQHELSKLQSDHIILIILLKNSFPDLTPGQSIHVFFIKNHFMKLKVGKLPTLVYIASNSIQERQVYQVDDKRWQINQNRWCKKSQQHLLTQSSK